MKKICFALILTFLLFACATPEKYDAALDGYLGHDKSYVIEKMGKPSAVKIGPDSYEVLSYVKADNVYVPSEFYLYGVGSGNLDSMYDPFLNDLDYAPYEAVFGYQVKYFCQTAFLLQNNMVIGWRWRGNNCVAD